MALALPGAEEHEHMNHPDFRVNGRIFATLGYPDGEWAMVKLYPEQQREFVGSAPRAFMPVKGARGQQGRTSVLLKAAAKNRVRDALNAAWRNAAVRVAKRQLETPAAKPKQRRAAKALQD